jgi:glutamate-ammonia-ligase adenylyltransferase
MRQKMHDGHPNDSGLFDIKHDHGGIVDVEFIVQYLVLAHAKQHAALTRNAGNIALLHMAAALGLVDAELSDRAAQAYRMFRRAQHTQRLQGATARVPAENYRDEIAAVQQLWRAMLGN